MKLKDLISVIDGDDFLNIVTESRQLTVSVLVDKDGAVFTSISKTVNDMLDMLEDIISDDGHALIEVCENTSNSGREFYQLMIL